ncbi:DUF2846 domain-containing protein [Methylophilus sp. Leaf414]|uniref:DUF2846 domain-containing protein n=1 Tax=Methylophilus sp. Leaf414 TaxID=1736371 RepID=UPI0006F8AFEA|nr:DUF2846 domain-containing protein [Methylophilus sp. Leaf414]KQT36735.1 hypothetical protein ASG24_06235 [Methylophilus sp. Leaf414]
MKNKTLLVTLSAFLVVGCASVPMESSQKTSDAKKFQPPADGKSGLYVYRYGSFGGALKKDVWVDGKCLGETAPNVFFFQEVSANQEHKISTESEFSPNDLLLKTESGKNYFIQQYIKFGVAVGGAGLKLVDETEGQKQISGLGLASQGHCSQ